MQSRFGPVIAAALLLATLPGTAAATHSGGAGPKEDFAVGTAEVVLAPPFDASRLHVNWPPSSSPPPASHSRLGRGSIVIDGADSTAVHGDLLCLEAVGNSATFRGVVTRSSDPLVPPGSGLAGQLVANGEDDSRPDEAAVMLTDPPTGPVECPPPLTTSPVDRGNYVVHDSGGR